MVGVSNLLMHGMQSSFLPDASNNNAAASTTFVRINKVSQIFSHKKFPLCHHYGYLYFITFLGRT